MEIKDADKCESIASNTDKIEQHIKKLCKNGACSGELKKVLFPQKFIRIKYICEGNTNNISRRDSCYKCNATNVISAKNCECLKRFFLPNT